jgi:predicted ATPase
MGLEAKPYLREFSIRADAQFDEDEYPFSIPAVHNMGTVELHPDVTFFVGENGAGKSTILEALAINMKLPSEGGTRDVYRSQREVSELEECLQLVKSFRTPKDSFFLRAESMFNVFSYFEGSKNAARGRGHERSHGESFMDIMLDFRPRGLYLLDEPEAALSPSRQLAALSAIHNLVQQECQFIIATHSPILLSYPNAKILLFDGSGITEVAYEDTEHFAITRDFLNHHERRLEQLFADDE